MWDEPRRFPAMASTSLRIPAYPLACGVPLPALCIRHGGIAVGTRKATFKSKTPTGLFLVVGLAAAFHRGKTIKAPALPVCARCLSGRRTRSGLIGGPLLVVLAILVGLAAAVDPTGPLLPILVFAILVLTPVFAVFVAIASPSITTTQQDFSGAAC